MKTKKRFLALALCSAFLILASVVGATAAWFTDNVTVSGTAKTGNLTVALNVGGTDYAKGASGLSTVFTKSNIMPGDKICDAIGVKVTTTDTNAYIRVQFTIDGDKAAVAPTLDGAWKLGDDGWYYYGTQAAPTKAAVNTVISFCTDATLSGEGTGNTAMNDSISVSITVQAVQASNQGSTIAWN